jgi:predicted dehydrogenase
MKLGIFGCGDFLRCQESGLNKSERVTVHSLYDPDAARAQDYAQRVGGSAVATGDEIFADAEVDAVLLFVPPQVRLGLMEKAAAAGKHILTTKPLAPHVPECDAMRRAVDGKVRCGVMYGRTGNAAIETLSAALKSGRFGRLALYRQDWLHHYPQWNNWALDPEKNGGPFMDAMIHNLNAARYLMDSPAERAVFFGESLAHDLPCNDTESMRVAFASGGVADLFITWAADLGVESTEGNYREHIDLNYMVTDQAWHITQGDGEWIFSKDGKKEAVSVQPLPSTVFDRFADAVEADTDLPRDIVSLASASEDIRILRSAAAQPGVMTCLAQ